MRVDEASTRRDLVPMSLRIGARMRDHGLSFLEEPVPFDFYEETVSSSSSSLRSEKGRLTVPSGPGLGVTIDPAFLRAATRLA